MDKHQSCSDQDYIALIKAMDCSFTMEKLHDEVKKVYAIKCTCIFKIVDLFASKDIPIYIGDKGIYMDINENKRSTIDYLYNEFYITCRKEKNRYYIDHPKIGNDMKKLRESLKYVKLPYYIDKYILDG